MTKSGRGQSASPDVEVTARPSRRTFTAAYKLDILKQADSYTGDGEVGRLLRREGLYSSHLTSWRRQRDEGALRELGKRRGRKSKPVDKEKVRLEKDNERLRRKLEQAERIITIQKKVASLLGAPLANDDDEGST